jgi:hypothetical protein
MIPSNPIFERLTVLATCLCAEIKNPAWGVPDVCFCGVVPGDAVFGMYAGDCNDVCGMAWVRMVTVYPSHAVGSLITEPANCEYGLGVDVEMGITRCMSVGDEQGNLPSPAQQLAAVELQVADALIMQRALYCCDAIPHKDVILGQYQTIGPEGGLIGGTFTMSMAV